MASASGYFDDWAALVKRGIASYSEALRGLLSAREYHRERSSLPADDIDRCPWGIRVEIPLLWGTF